MHHLWLIPALPLAGFLVNGTVGRRLPKAAINAIGIGSVALSLAWVVRTLLALGSIETPHIEQYFVWIESDFLRIPAELKPGEYTLQLTIDDELGRKTATRSIGFRIK